ncbi:hypothetical protein CEP54_002880 [Fusarium duplospermum]|uniref:Uncharacterized protein n=1 Tax=Fusarium duplospermum TaxID=1325734 RepID=A0A428QST6_9HYPO|nr:hypothetical protein CEP54_002880 [Fusarium duplospermum]
MAPHIKRQIHWLTPVSMVGALLLGGLFALGHDLFYNNLAGTTVAADSFELAGAEVSRQQLNLAAGTTLAFLFKSAIVSAVSIAYFQAVWHFLKSSKREIDISNMDVLLSALGNAISLVSFSTWLKGPLLLLIAIVAWLIPVVSIITPATLSVGFASPPNALLQVPHVAFTGLSLLRWMPKRLDESMIMAPCRNDPSIKNCPSDLTIYLYNGPSDALRRVVAAAAAEGNILAIDAPAPNSSWSLEFLSPTLQCDEVTGDTRRRIEENIANFTTLHCDESPGYVAWTPTSTKDESLLPFFLVEKDGGSYYSYNEVPTYDREGRRPMDFRSPGFIPPNDLVLFMAIIPAALRLSPRIDKTFACNISEENAGFEIRTGKKNLTILTEGLFDSTSSVLRCHIHNSTYEARFNITNGNQHVKVKVNHVEEKPLDAITGVWASDPLSNNTECTPLNMDTECALEPSLLRHLSYQALMDAFSEILVGNLAIRRRKYDDSVVFHGNTSIRSTVLTNTPELQVLRNLTLLSKNWAMLHIVEPRANEWAYKGLWNGPGEQRTMPLKEALEELFQNITISLMSSPLLQPNKHSAFKPNDTEVTFSTMHPVYIYARNRLWLAYGLGIACSILILCIGMLAIHMNGASFSNTFSTLLRRGRGASLSSEIEKVDLDGRDPLPEYIKDMKIKFSKGSVQADEYIPMSEANEWETERRRP